MSVRSAGLGAAIGLLASGCSGAPSEVADPTESSQDETVDDAIPANCGNGVLDPGEDCEDDDDYRLDGCLPECRFGPSALLIGAPFASAQHGNLAGGAAFDDDCPPGQAIVGLRAQVSPEGWIAKLQGNCGELELVAREDGGFAIQVLDGEALGVHGTTEGTDAVARCPANHVVVSFSGRSGALVDQLVLGCAPLFVLDEGDTFALSFGPSVPSEPVGGEGGGPFGDTSCGEGVIATGLRIRASAAIDAFGLGCAPLVLQVGP